jgi:hypothetical protein
MTDAQTAGPASRAVRLIFEYDGDNVRLVLQQPVDVAVTGFDLARTERAGHFVEVRDAQGASLARVPVRDAMTASAEVFPEAPGQPITRVDVPTQGAFTVVVPATEAARRVAIVRSEPVAGTALPQTATSAPPPAPAVRSVDIADFELEA